MAEVPKDDLAIFEQVSKEKDQMKAFIKGLLVQIKLKNGSLDIDMICEAMFLLFEGCTVSASLYHRCLCWDLYYRPNDHCKGP
jgi:hypothetical protein